MANEIKVNTTRLGSDAEHVGRLITNMEKQLKNMKADIDQLNGMWEGPAKKTFVSAFENDRIAASEIIKELKSLQNFESQAKGKYEKCEHEVSSLVDSIHI